MTILRYGNIKLRRGTAAFWTATDPVLLAGEPGFETDTGKGKVGDGVTAWSALSYTWDPAAQQILQAGGYAEIHCHDAAVAQNIGPGAGYTQCTAFTDNGLAANCTPDVANDKITITVAGVYRVAGAFSFMADTNNVTWAGAAHLDGVEQNNVHWERKVGTGADVGAAGCTGIISVPTVPVDLDFRVKHDNAGTVALTLTYANLNLEYLGSV